MLRKSVFLLLSIFLCSCQQEMQYNLQKSEGKSIKILDSIPANDSVAGFIEPYKQHIDKEMNSILAYSKFHLSKTDGAHNTAIGNMMADAVMELASPVFEGRTGNKIDMVLLNHGGIRSTINQGNITTRTAYQVMPFENEIVVAELDEAQMQELFKFLQNSKSAHPVSGIQLTVKDDSNPAEIFVQSKPFPQEKSYFVATNDYLLNGGDSMNFFKNRKNEVFLDYKLRNLLIDYFKKHDTIAPVRDQRFTILEK